LAIGFSGKKKIILKPFANLFPFIFQGFVEILVHCRARVFPQAAFSPGLPAGSQGLSVQLLDRPKNSAGMGNLPLFSTGLTSKAHGPSLT
jgi:hypothetical protein